MASVPGSVGKVVEVEVVVLVDVEVLVDDVVGGLVTTPDFALCFTFFLPLLDADFDVGVVALLFGDVVVVLVLAGWFVGVELESAEARKDGSGGNAEAGARWPAASAIPTVTAATTITPTTDMKMRRLGLRQVGTLVLAAGGASAELVDSS